MCWVGSPWPAQPSQGAPGSLRERVPARTWDTGDAMKTPVWLPSSPPAALSAGLGLRRAGTREELQLRCAGPLHRPWLGPRWRFSPGLTGAQSPGPWEQWGGKRLSSGARTKNLYTHKPWLVSVAGQTRSPGCWCQLGMSAGTITQPSPGCWRSGTYPGSVWAPLKGLGGCLRMDRVEEADLLTLL